jgi:hypothetical protein
VAAAAFRWLDRTGEAPGRGHVIRALLSVQWLPGEYADRAVAVALSALTGVELLEGRHSIIALLLERAELQPDSGVDTAAVVELALRRVDGMSTSDRAYVYGRLARLDGVPVEAFDRILGWLATDEAQRHRGAVLPGLMRNPSLSTEQRGRVTDLATDALVGTVLSADAGIVNALPSPTDLTVEQAARITAWIDDSAAGIRDPVLLNVLLRRPDLTGPRRAELRRAAQDVLVTIDDERDCSSLATALLADAAITDDEIDELLAGTAGRVERTALVIAIAGRQHVHERHRRLVDDQFSAAWAAGERRHVLRLLKEAFGPEAPDGRWPSLRDLARRCLAAHPDLAEGVVVPEEPDGPEESGPAQNGPAQNGPAQNGADRAGQNGAGRAGRDADGLPSEPGRRSFWRRLLPGRRR